MKITKLITIIGSTILLLISVMSSSCVTGKYFYYHDLSYGTDSRHELDLYLPRRKTGDVGLILSIHGGGWTAGDKEVYREANAYYCGELGYVAAAINYRYASASVDAFDIMDDVSLALSYIKERAINKNINVNKVILTGHSAGAHLSLLYAYSRIEEAPVEPVAVMALSGPTDLTNEDYIAMPIWQYAVYPLFSKISGFSFDASNYEVAVPYLQAVSPVSYVTAISVPTIICHGVYDSIVPYSDAQRLDDVLSNNGVTHRFYTFPTSDHGLEKDPEVWQAAKETFILYAQEYLS